ncbi:hypothetical protein SAR11G3_00918 [Candidatus Pelagibacter sp. IMCC9063]|nr:hypothetical protein SAR11G3_00918 [Candidatus Pelagibacter sp. IMCC9063]
MFVVSSKTDQGSLLLTINFNFIIFFYSHSIISGEIIF